MPYPAQVTPDRILDRAAQLIELHGAEQMSLHQLAADLGIKTPSLYRYFAGKADLVRALNLRTAEGLVAAMRNATAQSDDAANIVQMGLAYRQYALTHPRLYLAAYGSGDPSVRPDEALLAALAGQIQAVVAPLSRTVDSLTALRGLWALVHGFVTLELTSQMQRGGDLGQAFEAALRVYVRGLRA